MLSAINLAKDWHKSNYMDTIPFGPRAWMNGKFVSANARYAPVSKAKAYCFGLTEIYSPSGREVIGNTLLRDSGGFTDHNGRASIRLHLSSGWHGQSVNIDIHGHEDPKRRKRDLKPLGKEQIIGYIPEYLDMADLSYENNTYVTVTTPLTDKTREFQTIQKDNPDKIFEY